jgi:hypothetical protein
MSALCSLSPHSMTSTTSMIYRMYEARDAYDRDQEAGTLAADQERMIPREIACIVHMYL